jgi:hypothetical protein
LSCFFLFVQNGFVVQDENHVFGNSGHVQGEVQRHRLCDESPVLESGRHKVRLEFLRAYCPNQHAAGTFFVANFLTYFFDKEEFCRWNLVAGPHRTQLSMAFHARREAVCLRKKVHVERCLGIVLPSTVKCSCKRVVGSESGRFSIGRPLQNP